MNIYEQKKAITIIHYTEKKIKTKNDLLNHLKTIHNDIVRCSKLRHIGQNFYVNGYTLRKKVYKFYIDKLHVKGDLREC